MYLGLSSRSGRKYNVCCISAAGSCSLIKAATTWPAKRILVHCEDYVSNRPQELLVLSRAEKDLCSNGARETSEPFHWVRRIKRHECTACFQNTQHSDYGPFLRHFVSMITLR
jgi:hypothetical protein